MPPQLTPRIDELSAQTTWTEDEIAEYEHLLAHELHFPLLSLITHMTHTNA